VRQALDYVARGEVDAGFVYATDAAAANGRVRVALALPLDVPLAYPAAPVAASSSPEARRFLDFLASPAARAVFTQAGFAAP
jgi:molybdate transport system substrate-binding protein